MAGFNVAELSQKEQRKFVLRSLMEGYEKGLRDADRDRWRHTQTYIIPGNGIPQNPTDYETLEVMGYYSALADTLLYVPEMARTTARDAVGEQKMHLYEGLIPHVDRELANCRRVPDQVRNLTQEDARRKITNWSMRGFNGGWFLVAKNFPDSYFPRQKYYNAGEKRDFARLEEVEKQVRSL